MESLKRAARAVNEELAFAEGFVADTYRAGFVRFLPRGRRDARMIVHDSQDVVCLVLAGTGRLRQGKRSSIVQPGTLCRIPAGTPHDFVAVDEPLELLYATINVRTASSSP
jgi:mannose-6-phosphate isomerase-like protein (cupin superfamily)